MLYSPKKPPNLLILKNTPLDQATYPLLSCPLVLPVKSYSMHKICLGHLSGENFSWFGWLHRHCVAVLRGCLTSFVTPRYGVGGVIVVGGVVVVGGAVGVGGVIVGLVA